MDSTRGTDTQYEAAQTLGDHDLSALAWVQEELRKSLDTAHKALRRFLKDAEAAQSSDVDDVDPAVLRTARLHVHQGVGALELVDLAAGATLLRASEAAIQRFVGKPRKLDAAAVDTIEKASFALLDYIGRLLAGKPVPPVALFPQYNALQTLAGAERVHPADLWAHDWQWREWPAPAAAPVPADAEAVNRFESDLLTWMRRSTPQSAQALGELSAGLASGAGANPSGALWRLAAAFFEALAAGRLPTDVHVKRTVSRLLAQLRGQLKDAGEPSQRLAQDLLFFCAQAGDPVGGSLPQLAAARTAYGLTGQAPVDYQASALGRYDPSWVAQAKKRVSSLKEAWSAVAGGDMLRLPALGEQFSLVGESLKRLYPQGEVLADAMQQAGTRTVQGGAVPPTPLAMEVATSVLYLEASLEDGDFDHPDQAQRVGRLAARLQAVGSGAPGEPLDAWMEELYRRVSDRQTMGSVVQELRSSLSEAEKQIDGFFRQPEQRELLIPATAPLKAMRGVLSVLGLGQASQAVLRMCDDIDALALPDADTQQAAQAGVFDRLASNLGALGFLVDMLGVQPQLAKTLFSFDSQTGVLQSSALGKRSARPQPGAGVPEATPAASVAAEQAPRLIEQAQSLADAAVRGDASLADVSEGLARLSEEASELAAEQPELAASISTAQAAVEQAEQAGAGPQTESLAREQVAQAMADFVISVSEPMGLDPLDEPQLVVDADRSGPVSAPAPLVPTVAPTVVDTGLEEDDEMRGIFLEEAREVIGQAREALAGLADDAGNIEQITVIRRAFHTLKGSSRMVGLNDFGEAGWACEQLYNAWLASQQPASPDLQLLTSQVLDELAQWTDEIEARTADGRQRQPICAVADTLRQEGRRIDLAVGAIAMPPPEVIEAAPAFDVPAVEQSPAEPSQEAFPVPDARVGAAPADVAFSLDLSALDTPVEAAPAYVEPPSSLPDGMADGVAEPLVLEGEPGADFESRQDALTEPLPMDLIVEGSGDQQATQELSPDFVRTTPGNLDSIESELETISLDLPPDDPVAEAPFVESSIADAPVVPLAPEDTISPSESLPGLEVASVADVANMVEVVDFGHAEPLEPAPIPVVEAVGEPMADIAQTLPEVGGEEAANDATGDPGNEQVKVIGPLRISIPLFNIYLNEADELSRRLVTELAEWSLELNRPVGDTAVALAHSLAGSSATVGFQDLSQLARQLEHLLEASHRLGQGTPEDAQLYSETAEELRRLLHQFAAGFLKSPAPALQERLSDHERDMAARLEARSLAPESGDTPLALSQQALDDVLPMPDDTAQPAPFESVPVAEFVPEAGPVLEAEPVPVTEAAPTLPGELGLPEFKAFEPLAAAPDVATISLAAHADAPDLDIEDDIDAEDAVDADLFPIFEEEAQELLPTLSSQMRDWLRRPADPGGATGCMRTLHTLKGGARLAGAMRLGEMAHRLESAIEALLSRGNIQAADVEALESRADALNDVFEALRHRDAQAYQQASQQASAQIAEAVHSAPAPLVELPPVPAEPLPLAQDVQPLDVAEYAPTLDAPVVATEADALGQATGLPQQVQAEGVAGAAAPELPPIDWSRFALSPTAQAAEVAARPHAGISHGAVRVRAQLLDRLVNHAGEVSITRSRLASEVGQIKGSLGDLTENLDRLRQQLRDIEFQAETQMSTRMEAARAASQNFDPLEFDRYTRFQELTRMMAESVNDVATVQRSLQRTLDTAEDQLAMQARLTRDLQDDLLRTRMVEFEGLSDRLYRVVRQAAKETGKQVRLDIVGGAIEVDRGVLDRMTGAFEHLLRNCVTHGIEPPDVRTAAGKEAAGAITVALRQEGNEVSVEFRDDGAGLNLERIRQKGVNMGLLAPDAQPGEAELANLIFTPGFSTADSVTELAGRGIGMDVVRSEVNAMGGRIETATAVGQGTSFKLILPLTTAVTQVVMLRCGDATVAVPTHLIEIVRRAAPAEMDRAYESGAYHFGELVLPFFWLGALLQQSPRGLETGRTLPVVVVRSAQQRVALHVDEVLGNQEVVVKNLGPQLARLPGLAGMTLLASGTVALIYNPVALATVYGDVARAMTHAALHPQADGAAGEGGFQLPAPQEAAAPAVPLILVVDDSLTVRRVTQRLLVREGYRVTLAKDGMDALERLGEERPSVVLSDIEMPRMDGFDLVRNIRGDRRIADLPVIMITSRIAQKHREYAAELGVNHYLGKPYSEEELLALIARYTALPAQLTGLVAGAPPN